MTSAGNKDMGGPEDLGASPQSGAFAGQHTPTPWRAQDNGVFYHGDGWRELVASTSTERSQWRANAAFIVLAANTFHGLKEALEFYANPSVYKAHPHGLAFDDRDLSFVARAALAKITAGE